MHTPKLSPLMMKVRVWGSRGGGVGPWCSDTPSGKQKNGWAISCFTIKEEEERSEEKVPGRGERRAGGGGAGWNEMSRGLWRGVNRPL
jgi:hypothetical protein